MVERTNGTQRATDLMVSMTLLSRHFWVGMLLVTIGIPLAQLASAGEANAGVRLIHPRRIALNPDCGFAPGSGEPPSIDEAYEKLCRLANAASRLRSRSSATVSPA